MATRLTLFLRGDHIVNNLWFNFDTSFKNLSLYVVKAGPPSFEFVVFFFFDFLHSGIERVKSILSENHIKKFKGKVCKMCHRSCSLV